jgi:hypothetical protein
MFAVYHKTLLDNYEYRHSCLHRFRCLKLMKSIFHEKHSIHCMHKYYFF